MPEDKEEGIEVDIDDNNDDFEMIEPITSSEDVEEGSTEPVEIFKEEVVTVVENPNAEEKEKEEENEEQAFRIDNSIGEDENVYGQVKAQSVQLRKLTDVVESLQSQVKQLQETIRLGGHKTAPVRRRTRTNTKTRKKTITGRSRRTRGRKKK
jgi:hypothetical protein